MGSIPILSGPEVVRVFELLGWSVARRRGSHIVMVKAEEIATLSYSLFASASAHLSRFPRIASRCSSGILESHGSKRLKVSP